MLCTNHSQIEIPILLSHVSLNRPFIFSPLFHFCGFSRWNSQGELSRYSGTFFFFRINVAHAPRVVVYPGRGTFPQGTATDVILCRCACATILHFYCSGAALVLLWWPVLRPVCLHCFSGCLLAFFALRFFRAQCSCMHLWHAALSNVPVHSSEQL